MYFANNIQSVNKWLLGYVIANCYITDVFAFFVGLKFGKHKLNERISPKKTIEGSIGYTGQNGISALPVTGSFKLESDNLTVTTPTPTTTGVPEIKMNLVWGAIPSSAS